MHPTTRWMLRRALRAERVGALDEAVVRYRDVVREDGATPVWSMRLGRVLIDLDRLDEAVDAFSAAVAAADAPASWHAELAELQQRRGDLASAAVAYQAAIDRDPTPVDWYEKLGTVRRALRDWAGAAEAFRGAALRAPHRADLVHWWGDSVEKTRDWVRASYLLRRADQIACDTSSRRRLPSHRLSLDKRIHLSLLRRPQYAYGLQRACGLAERLGVARVTAIELGVAGGNGLIALEAHAHELERLTGVAVDVVGFDTGQGLFAPVDQRDMPHFFAAGSYAMDVEALRARLDRARLMLGDARETVAGFLDEDIAPIGFVSFDMDVYSATAAVLALFGDGAGHDAWLPRTTMYFDDVSGRQGQDYNPHAGELLAIDEFNAHNRRAKLAEDRTFRTLPIDLAWHHGTYTLHRFDHPAYDSYVSPADEHSLSLRDA